ncbi:uncharacterized protein Z518_05104 [Rhinocladiella mackenziei CBS 650.93]|uniref:Cupin type-1 domain-containing protein n=1 Tax=Rhinocladiella mackenziei CBS 650.93 TaxID=1442369 RepID=A0A0D2FXV7_9EURO|nr:uncharacterized protein Z518_05104 [Rhinocladiella mackenziei CBS 650.93]KIX07127.1 hypothetical protein Z518_05104 [Rhinocladiella mackenziei CBS 650.93]
MVCEPETYYLKPNKHAPNNDMPVLIYRDCLPLPLSEDRTTGFLEAHAWVKKGVWGHIPRRHFHPNTHECYGVFQGSSTILVGCGTNDTDGGEQIDVQAGDVIVLPAGTGHCNLQSTPDYRYIGVYPEGAPKWRNELGEEAINLEEYQKEINGVDLPLQDPVNGADGPLLQLWAKPSD